MSQPAPSDPARRLPTITILGSLNMDLVSYVPHHPLAGETLTATSFAISPGGKGANQAVACSKLSRSSPGRGGEATAQVRMVGLVGADTYGAALRTNLARHGVDVTGVSEAEGEKTGVAVIIVEEATGENRIVVSAEANGHVTGREEGLLMPRPDLLIMQLEVPLAAVEAAAAAARAASVPVLLNPAPALPLPEALLRAVDHLVVNETEAAAVSGAEARELDSPDGCARVAATLLRAGPRYVVITLGARGVYFASSAAAGLVPAEKATVVDTTAAGDTFVGQYALEVVSSPPGKEFDIDSAVRKANRAAARTVERKGAQDSIPWRDELE